MALSYLDTAKEIKERLQSALNSVESSKRSIQMMLETARKKETELASKEEAEKAAEWFCEELNWKTYFGRK